MSTVPERSIELWPLVLYFAAVIGLVSFMLIIAHFMGSHRKHASTTLPFEAGIVPIGFARLRVSTHFYLVAMFFVLFDLESVFILAWGISFRKSGWVGYAEVLIFIVELLVGLAYIWRLGALDWRPKDLRASFGGKV